MKYKVDVVASKKIISDLINTYKRVNPASIMYISDPKKWDEMLEFTYSELTRMYKPTRLFVFNPNIEEHNRCFSMLCDITRLNMVVKKVLNKGRCFVSTLVRIDDAYPDRDNICYVDLKGFDAYRKMLAILKKKYTEDEIKQILNDHEAEASKPAHVQPQYKVNEVIKVDNVYYCDINNAHGSALLELFPRCKTTILHMYDKRKETINGIPGYYKKLFNYFFGYLCRVGHRGTYNWVVNRTYKTLVEFIKSYNGTPYYINTDGVMMVPKTSYVPENSDKMGNFKVKSGTLYYTNIIEKGYSSYHYITFKANDGTEESKSTILKELRKNIDLEKGIVMLYNKVKENGMFVGKDITTKEVQVNG